MGPLVLVALVFAVAGVGVVEPILYLRKAHRQIAKGTYVE